MAALRVIAVVLWVIDIMVGGTSGASMAQSWAALRTAGCAFTDPLNSGRCADAHNGLWLFGGLLAVSVALAAFGSWALWRTSLKQQEQVWAAVAAPIAVMLLIAWFLAGIRVEF